MRVYPLSQSACKATARAGLLLGLVAAADVIAAPFSLECALTRPSGAEKRLTLSFDAGRYIEIGGNAGWQTIAEITPEEYVLVDRCQDLQQGEVCITTRLNRHTAEYHEHRTLAAADLTADTRGPCERIDYVDPAKPLF